MSSNADPHALRATFDAAAELYDRARPVPPPQVFDDLVELARLEPGARVVEIGCGTGQATLPLAERRLAIVGIELGTSLADVARRRLSAFPDVEIVTSSFEDWDAGDQRFDAVVAFNSLHWVDPEVRFAKSAALLRDGGALAAVGMRFVEHDAADPLWLSLREDYEAAGVADPWPHIDAIRDRSAEFAETGHFEDVATRRYTWDVPFDAEGYIGLLQTVSWQRVLDEDARAQLFERIRRRLGDGRIAPTMAAVLYVARRQPA